MSRAARAAIAVSALAAGLWFGGFLAQTELRRADPALVLTAGWRPANPNPEKDPLSAALARAERAARDPAAFPDEVIATFLCDADADGRSLLGASRYVLRFAPNGLPPADAFWALSTLGAPRGETAVLASTARDLRRGADGSLEVHVGAQPPDDPAANWLAAPSGAFRLVLRAYAPRPALGQSWSPPPLRRRETSA